MPDDRHVLCVSRSRLDSLAGPGPWSNGSEHTLQALFNDPGSWAWLPRADTEDSPEWRQIIPVLAIRRETDGALLIAQRLAKAGEPRLNSRWTLMPGGHCDRATDDRPDAGPRSALIHCLARELSEELAVPPGLTLARLDARPVGLIHASDEPVDRAHLGWVWLGHYAPEWGELEPGEEFAAMRWESPAALQAAVTDGFPLESWGRIVLAHLMRSR